jgi:hypothetical protein
VVKGVETLLKVNEIQLKDAKGNTYIIKGHQIENFPLIGGEEANIITIKSWNQHGNSYVNSYMETFQGELYFMFTTFNKSNAEIFEEREKITSICNPLNGTINMKVILNSGHNFSRDITFLTAPVFPIGFENRNRKWQKVLLNFEANNPFWYSEASIIETFLGVEPLFYFPFTMSTTTPIVFGNVIPNNIAVNEGQAEAPVTIRIVGACVNPRIDNVTTGEFIQFKDLTMQATDELLIDTTFGQKKVELNGVNVFNKLDFSSTFFNLIIGENEIEFKDDSGSTDATIHFIYRNLFVTI